MTTTLLACAAITFALPDLRPSLDRQDAALLKAIAQVERGPAHNPTNLSEGARAQNKTPEQHLAWIRRTLIAKGCVPNPYIMALCWRCGVERVTDPKRVKEVEPFFEYAERVRNLLQ